MRSSEFIVERRDAMFRDEITEAFDYPYKLKWEKSSYGDIDASATLDDGNYLNISFNQDENQDGKLVWNVEFDRNYSQAVTGEGDAQRVFATVLSAIQIFIKKYKPLKLAFGASKEVDQGQNSQSRARLYDSLVQRYARAWGYRVFRADTGNLVIYEFSRIQKPKAVGEDYNNRFAKEGVAEGLGQINEYRDRLFQYVKSLLPTWPDYILKDWLVPNKGNFSNLPADALKNSVMEKVQGAGLTTNTKWQLIPNMKFTMDMFNPKTKQLLIGRAGGSSDLGMGIPKDKERHTTQATLAQQQGGIRKEPVILIKSTDGYELLEGWHRTIQHFVNYPDGYTGPAYVAVAQGQQGVTEAEAATKNSNEIWRQLKAAGYQYVASGADATVWAKDESHVIKILMPEDLGNKAEQVFRKFYEIALKYQDLPCLPRVNEVNTIDIKGKDYTQIEMERLQPIKKGTFLEGVIWFFSDFCQAQEPWDRVDHAMGLTDTWEYYPYAKGSKSIAGVFTKPWQDLMYDKRSYSMYRQLYNVMKLLYTTGNINKFGWDLHTANVMQRGDGQPVIIDPWFSEGTS